MINMPIRPLLRIVFSTDTSTGACSIFKALRVAWKVWRLRGILPRSIELSIARQRNGVYYRMCWDRIPWPRRIRIAQALRRYIQREVC
jgi:hypothetical protein